MMPHFNIVRNPSITQPTRHLFRKLPAQAAPYVIAEFSNHEDKSFGDAGFCGQSFAEKGELLKNLSPLVFTMKLFGLYFRRRNPKRKDDVEWTFSMTTTLVSSSFLRTYATVFLIFVWLNAIRFLTGFTRADHIGATLFMKTALMTWCFLIAIIQTAYYYANHNGQLLKVLRSLPVTLDCIRGARRAAIGLTGLIWISVIAQEAAVAYFYFRTNGKYDFALTPFATHIEVPDENITIVRVGGVLVNIIIFPSSFFAQAMSLILVYIFCHQFKNLETNFSRALDKHGQFSGDLSAFRRRHQTLSSAVSKVDEFMMLSNVGGFICHIANVIAMLYSIMFYPEAMATWTSAVSYVFWLTASATGLLFAATAGIAVNYMAHKLHDKVFDIDLSAMNADTIGEVNVFLNRLNGQPIGFSVLGIFVIDKNTILTILGVLITYFLVVVQFAKTSTGSRAANETNMTVVPL